MIPNHRRDFLLGTARGTVRVGLAAAVLYGLQGALRTAPESRPREEARLGILRPPGALDEGPFLSACIRCALCSQACDTACIRLFGPDEGRLAGTPFIAAADRACNLCLACTEVCPSGALQLVRDGATVRMGVAVVDERLCVSHNGTGACGACHTVCPFRNHAITQGIYNRPTVHPDRCVGCGLCEEACIVRDRRAIQVVTDRRWTS